ncbi:MAG: hypothetical protein ACWGOX_09575 [Desulforhopalus sp.]
MYPNNAALFTFQKSVAGLFTSGKMRFTRQGVQGDHKYSSPYTCDTEKKRLEATAVTQKMVGELEAAMYMEESVSIPKLPLTCLDRNTPRTSPLPLVAGGLFRCSLSTTNGS